jgi:steroid delta-isomerase-like uncharacterized protein
MQGDNRTIIQEFVDVVWNKRHVDAVDTHFTIDAAIHDPSAPAVRDVEGLKAFIAAQLAALLDLRCVLEDCFAAEEKVATRWTMHGTHKAPFLGVAPTERPVTITGLTHYRLHSGKIVEYWTHWDSAGLLEQLGESTPPNARVGA